MHFAIKADSVWTGQRFSPLLPFLSVCPALTGPSLAVINETFSVRPFTFFWQSWRKSTGKRTLTLLFPPLSFFFFLFLLALHFHLLIIALSCVTEILMESGRLTPSCLDQCNMTGGAFWPGIFRLRHYGLSLPHRDTSLSGPNQIAHAACVCECVCVCVLRDVEEPVKESEKECQCLSLAFPGGPWSHWRMH